MITITTMITVLVNFQRVLVNDTSHYFNILLLLLWPDIVSSLKG